MAEFFYVLGGGCFIYMLIGCLIGIFESSQSDDPFNWTWLFIWPRIIFGK